MGAEAKLCRQVDPAAAQRGSMEKETQIGRGIIKAGKKKTQSVEEGVVTWHS